MVQMMMMEFDVLRCVGFAGAPKVTLFLWSQLAPTAS